MSSVFTSSIFSIIQRLFEELAVIKLLNTSFVKGRYLLSYDKPRLVDLSIKIWLQVLSLVFSKKLVYITKTET